MSTAVSERDKILEVDTHCGELGNVEMVCGRSAQCALGLYGT